MPRMSNARLSLVLAGAIAVPHVFAQTLPPSVAACADETDVLKRLACYDREVARYRTPASATTTPRGPTPSPAPASTAAPASAPNSPPPAPASNASAAEVADFGMNGELKRKETGADSEPQKLEKLTARLASVSARPTGEGIYSLEGGQVWVEAETESHIPLHPGEEVTIKRGVLGAFYLSSAEVRGLRVKRLH